MLLVYFDLLHTFGSLNNALLGPFVLFVFKCGRDTKTAISYGLNFARNLKICRPKGYVANRKTLTLRACNNRRSSHHRCLVPVHDDGLTNACLQPVV